MAGESARDRANQARARSERLARYAEQWEKGAEGESRTAAELARLGPEWTCWHDLRWPGRRLANIDHIVIGPGGIFVVDSKNWTGKVAVKDGVLRQNGYQRESAVAGCADSALAVGELVPEYLDAVKPVLCFVRDESVEGWARDVMLCSTGNLVEMLASRPRVFSHDQAAHVAARLRARVSTALTRDPSASGTRQVGHRMVKRESSPPARPASGNRRKGMPRFFVGLGIWFCFMVVIGVPLGAFPAYSDRVLTPAAVVAGVVSWRISRRIIR